jgi:integrase
MSGILSKFAHYFQPKAGCMWLCASAFTANAATVNRCPTHWPKGSDFEGRACANATERLRAQCYLAHGSLRKLARQARDGAPSTKHLAELSEVMRRHPRPAVGLVVFLRRVWSSVPDPQNPRGAQELARLQFAALLALHLWRPVRPGELKKITVDHVYVDNDGRGWCALPPPGKNRHSEAARQERSEFPPELVPFLKAYLEVARPHLARGNCRALFPVPDRGAKNDKALPMSDEAFRDRLDRYVVEFAADLFPLGLRPHLLRHIVATDLFVRFGFFAGVELAARALRNSTIAVKKHYLFLTETKAPTDTRKPTQSMAVAAAFAEAAPLVQQAARTA